MISLKIPYREWALVLAVILYGLFSQPTPDNPDVWELIIGSLLLIAIGTARILELSSGAALWLTTTKRDKLRIIAAYYLLLAPLVIGCANSLPLRAIIRDVIPLGYLLLPVILYLPRRRSDAALWALAFAGTAFAVRYWAITGASFHQLNALKKGDDLLYLPLEPAVLFAGLWLTFWGIEHINRLSFKINSLVPVLALICATLCFATMAGMMMRAALLAGAIAIGIFSLQHIIRAPRSLVPLGCLAVMALIIVWHPLLHLLTALAEKTAAVGVNARDREFAAVWHAITSHPLTFLFGQGWGAVLADPAVGNLRVGYTHSMFSYVLSKTGIIGTLIAALYLGSFAPAVINCWRRHNTLCLAVLPPLLLAFTLYTSYKYFTCGLLLWCLVKFDKTVNDQGAV